MERLIEGVSNPINTGTKIATQALTGLAQSALSESVETATKEATVASAREAIKEFAKTATIQGSQAAASAVAQESISAGAKTLASLIPFIGPVLTGTIAASFTGGYGYWYICKCEQLLRDLLVAITKARW